MSEVPLHETLESVTLHGKSLQAWHDWLTKDPITDEDIGHLRAPCSRYGPDGDACSWWALGCQAVYAAAAGEVDQPHVSLYEFQRLAVNDHDDVASLVYEHWHAVPEPLREMLGSRDDVRRLLSEEADAQQVEDHFAAIPHDCEDGDE